MCFGGRERIIKRGRTRIRDIRRRERDGGANGTKEEDSGYNERSRGEEVGEREDREVEKVSEEGEKGRGRGGITLLWKGALLR